MLPRVASKIDKQVKVTNFHRLKKFFTKKINSNYNLDI